MTDFILKTKTTLVGPSLPPGRYIVNARCRPLKYALFFFRDGDSLPFIIRRQKKKTRTAECLWKATRVESSGKRLNAFARARAHTHKHTSRGSAEDAFPSAQHVARRPLFPLAYATKQRHKTNERLLKHCTDASCMF